MDDETAYLQPEPDEEGRIDLRHETLDLEYLGMPRKEVEAVDLRGTDIHARTIDLMGLEAEGSIYAWSGSFDTELDVSHTESDSLYLRSADGEDVRAPGASVRERVELSRSSFSTVDMSDADVGLLHVEDADIDTIDLSGSTVERLDADADYGFVVDEGTEFGELPDELEGLRVYEETTSKERVVLEDVVSTGDIDAGRLDDSSYSGAIGSLLEKGLLVDGARYGLSDRSEEFAEYL